MKISRRCMQVATPLASSYRHAMSRLAATASIITTNSAGEGPTERRGLTVSSLTSLSIQPQPLISFNVQVPSRTREVLHQRGEFAVNILPPTQDSKQLCRAFAGMLGSDLNPFDKFGQWFAYDKGRHMTTINFANTVLYCTMHDVLMVQDHEIWVAKVDSIREQVDQPSMIFQNHGFHHLGPEF